LATDYDQVIPVRGKRFNVSTLEESIALILRSYGSLHDCRELTPSEIARADLRAENLICVRQFKKGKWGLDRYSTSIIGLRVFKVSRSGGGGGKKVDSDSLSGLSDIEKLTIVMANKSAAMAAFYRSGKSNIRAPYLAGLKEEEINDQSEPTVHIRNPKQGAIVIRGLRGINIDGSSSQTDSVALSWKSTSSGNESITSNGNWEGILSLDPDEHELTATNGGLKHTVKFTVILKEALTGYTAEDIQLINSFKWGSYNKSPEAQLVQSLAREAGLVEKDDDFSDNITGSVVTDRVKSFASNARGDFNLYYSGSGDKAFIEKKIDRIFGKHLGQEIRVTLIETILAKKSAGFVDATNAFHEAMNNTLNIFFAKNSIGRMIAEMDNSLSVNPTMTLMMDAAKTVVNVKLNIELGLESNGAPQLMQKQADIAVFDMVAMEVVGAAVGGVVLKAGSSAFKVIKSYFGKFKHRFSKTKNPKVFENRAPHHTIGNPNLIPTSELKKKTGIVNYVVLEDRRLVVCGSGKNKGAAQPGTGHIDLANGKKVIAAGEVHLVAKRVHPKTGEIIPARLKYIDNSSGHYVPVGKNAQKEAEKAWRKTGYDVNGKYIEKYYDMQGGRGWIPVSDKIQ